MITCVNLVTQYYSTIKAIKLFLDHRHILWYHNSIFRCTSYLFIWVFFSLSVCFCLISSLAWVQGHFFLSWWWLDNNFVEKIGLSWGRDTIHLMRKICCTIASLQHILWPYFMTVLELLWMMKGTFLALSLVTDYAPLIAHVSAFVYIYGCMFAVSWIILIGVTVDQDWGC